MSTPAIPQPAKTEIISAYLKTHERLIIVALAIALSAWGLSKYYDRAATLADARAVIADAHAAIVDKTAAQSLATLQLALAEKDATNLMLAQQNAALAAAITSRQTAVVVQQKKDATLPPTDLALKITALADAPPAEVTVEGDSIRLGRNASVSVAQALEVAPVLQASLNDETTIAKNTQVELDAANGFIVKQGGVITDLNTARTADGAKCTADLKQVTADAKKQNMKWFKRGIFVGFFGGLYAHTLGL